MPEREEEPMSDQTPDRLKNFRAQYPTAPRKSIWMGVVQLLATVAGFVVLAVLILRPGPQAQDTIRAATGFDRQRELAVYLSEKGQPAAAIQAYQEYLDHAELAAPDRAKICVAAGKLAADAERYDDALAYLYQAEFLDPQSDLKEEINKKIVFCLEKLGRNVDLRQELRERTRVKRSAADVQQGEVILADVAGEIVTNRDLEQEIEKLPQTVRDSFNTPEKKTELLKNLVAERLLTDKARRLELDKDPAVQDQLAKAMDTMIVQKLIADEVQASVKVTPEDVERFYKAEPDRFKEPATAEVQVAKADSEEAAKAVTEFKDKPVTVVKGGAIPGVPASLTSDAVLAAESGSVTAPVQAEGAWYVFKIGAKKDERMPAFEEVKDRAARMFQSQKEREKVSGIIEEALQAQDVKLYPERLKETPAQ